MLETSVDVKLEHVFDVRIDFHERHVFGPVSGGAKQGYTSVKTGIVDGPRLKGKVLEYSGADWALVRPDGVVELNAHYLLQADDGTLIYIRNLGYVYGAAPQPTLADGTPAPPKARTTGSTARSSSAEASERRIRITRSFAITPCCKSRGYPHHEGRCSIAVDAAVPSRRFRSSSSSGNAVW